MWFRIEFLNGEYEKKKSVEALNELEVWSFINSVNRGINIFAQKESACGLMDMACAYGARDSRFEPSRSEIVIPEGSRTQIRLWFQMESGEQDQQDWLGEWQNGKEKTKRLHELEFKIEMDQILKESDPEEVDVEGDHKGPELERNDVEVELESPK